MRSRHTWLMLAGAAWLCACSDSNDTVTVRQDPSVDFNQYTTFAIADGSTLDPDVAARIPATARANMDYINQQSAAELVDHGLTQVGRDQDPDLLIVSFVYTSDVQGITYTCVPGTYWYDYWYYYWDPCAWIQPYVYDYTAGSVLVTLSDPALMRVVFAGLVQGVVDGASAQERQLRADEGVERIFNQYPVTIP